MSHRLCCPQLLQHSGPALLAFILLAWRSLAPLSPTLPAQVAVTVTPSTFTYVLHILHQPAFGSYSPTFTSACAAPNRCLLPEWQPLSRCECTSTPTEHFLTPLRCTHASDAESTLPLPHPVATPSGLCTAAFRGCTPWHQQMDPIALSRPSRALAQNKRYQSFSFKPCPHCFILLHRLACNHQD